MAAYYNEIDQYAAQWLRNLIAAGHIAPGDVDERSIEDVFPSDLSGYSQCHFFAGIGGWSYALRLAGWPDNRPVWSGSCPCQPFSAAGKRAAFADERHLWPAWHHLVSQCKPAVVFGEQVASPDGYAWLDLVQTDLEGTGYAFGPVVLPAAGVGAPHGRHRIFFVADANPTGLREQRVAQLLDGKRPAQRNDIDRCDTDGWMANAAGKGRGSEWPHINAANGNKSVRAGPEKFGRRCATDAAGPLDGYWRDADWIGCRDGKWRPVEPGTFPLANGFSSRVDKLRAYGNAIVPQVAEAFIRAYLESGIS